MNVILVHGRFATASLWSPLIERLPNRYRYLVIALPGFEGALPVTVGDLGVFEYGQLVAAIVGKLTHGPVAWVGHETGAALAVACALDSPISTASLTLINPAWFCEGLGGPRVGNRGWMMRHTIRQLLKASLNMDHEGAWMLQRPWDHWRTQVASSGSAVAAWRNLERTWPSAGQHPFWRRRLRELTEPVLMLLGSNDWVHPPEIAHAMLNRLPDAYLYESNCGHWPFLEKPDWVASKIQDFLFRSEPRVIVKTG